MSLRRRLGTTVAVVGCAALAACTPGGAPDPSPQTTVTVTTAQSPTSAGSDAWEPPTVSPAPTPSPSPSAQETLDNVKASSFYDAESGAYSFVTPSGNLHCSIDTSEAEPAVGCQSDAAVAEFPGACDGSPVVVFSPGREVGTGCTTDKPFYGGGPTLEYGQSLTVESLTCTSRSAGLTCHDRDGLGFTLARRGLALLG